MIANLLIAATMAAGAFPAEFADTNRFVRVDYARPFDVGLSVRRPSSTVNIDRKSDAVCVAVVPAEEYVRAWVLCAADPAPEKDPAFTVRLTRYVSGKAEHFLGRGKNAMADSLVELAGAAKRRVGETTVNGRTVPLWLVEVPLRTGDVIQDLVFTDRNGDYALLADELKAKGLTGRPGYLDFEILGRLKTVREAFTDARVDSDPAYTSAVQVVSVALEKPSCEMEMAWIRPGNVFWNDERPETQVKLRVKRPGDHRLVWTISTAEGTPAGGGERKVAADETLTVDLAQREPGWYRIDWTLFDGARTMLTHRSSYALLGEVHRQSGRGEPPYGCLGVFGAHYRLDEKTQQDVAGELLDKVGFRRSWQYDFMTPANREKYRFGGPIAVRIDDILRHPAWTDEDLKREVDRRIAAEPSLKMALIFWEHAQDPYRQAEEITGGVHDPKTDFKDADRYFAQAVRLAKFVRRNYPDFRILIGNSLGASELVAEMLRRGFPNELADHLGLEVVQRNCLPERMSVASTQGGAEFMRELGRHFGVSWTVNCCCEATFRLDTLIGEENQANWYVRDLLLMQTWGCKDIFIGDILDAGNHYCKDFWGNSGFTRRNPYLYPKKCFVGLATATKLLDRVVAREFLDTGDHGVFAVDFLRADGKHVCAIWTARGEADVALRTTGAFRVVDFYGRDRTSGQAVKASEAPCYVVSDGRAVAAAKTVARAYPGNAEEPGATRVVRTDDAAKWRLVRGKVEGLHGERGQYPCRLPGEAALRAVDDAEKGEVLELALENPDYTLPVLASEYAVIELKEPVELKGGPATIGAWVWGNSGWGNVNFVLEGADGRRMISCGCWKYGEREFDYDGAQTMCYTGWNFIRFPVLQRSPVQEKSSNEVENSWWIEGDGPPVEPLKFVGIAFSAQNRPLVLSERIAQPQKIRLHSVYAW